MNVEYSGWKESTGFFCYKIEVDELKLDYELHYASGKVATQNGPFQAVSADWNYDGDIYTQFGAWFQLVDENGRFESGKFWTPEQMVGALIDARDETETHYGDYVVSIPGIELPFLEKRPSLDEQIERSERRVLAGGDEVPGKKQSSGIRLYDMP